MSKEYYRTKFLIGYLKRYCKNTWGLEIIQPKGKSSNLDKELKIVARLIYYSGEPTLELVNTISYEIKISVILFVISHVLFGGGVVPSKELYRMCKQYFGKGFINIENILSESLKNNDFTTQKLPSFTEGINVIGISRLKLGEKIREREKIYLLMRSYMGEEFIEGYLTEVEYLDIKSKSSFKDSCVVDDYDSDFYYIREVEYLGLDKVEKYTKNKRILLDENSE